jgi:hypothetical protein
MQRVLRIAGAAEMGNTRRTRDGLMSRLHRFCQASNLPLSLNSAMMFIETTKTIARSKLTYLSAFSARIAPKPLIERYRAGLRRQAATEPLDQAMPASWEHVRMAMKKLRHRDALALYLGWRTAMRMDEIVSLRGIHVTTATARSITLWWGADTKTSSINPFQPQFYVEVVPPAPSLMRDNKMPELAAALRLLAPQETLATHPDSILAALQAVDGRLSGHSIKRGALTELTAAAVAGRFPVHLIPLVAKHQDGLAQLPSSTIRYMGNPVDVAKLLNTRAATAWL